MAQQKNPPAHEVEALEKQDFSNLKLKKKILSQNLKSFGQVFPFTIAGHYFIIHTIYILVQVKFWSLLWVVSWLVWPSAL